MLILHIDISVLIFYLIVILFVLLIIVALPIVFLRYIYKLLTKRGYKLNGYILICINLMLALYLFLTSEIYEGFYPTNSFYFDEFTEVTLRKPPKSAQIINKFASYPDFHGDYCSASLIKLSKEDYNLLLNELTNDNRIIKGVKLIGSNELDNVIGNYKEENIIHSFTRHIPNEEDHYLYIGFLDDKQTIIVTICVT